MAKVGANSNALGDLAATLTNPDPSLALVVVVAGTNDYYRTGQVAPDTTRIAGILERVAPNAARIWVGPPACPRQDVAANLADIVSRQQSALNGRPWGYTDSRPLTEDATFRSDEVHPTAAGYRLWADRLVNAWHAQGNGGSAAVVASAGEGTAGPLPWPVVAGVAALAGLGLVSRFFGRR
jgi:lysophospholipase L1-like esterase